MKRDYNYMLLLLAVAFLTGYCSGCCRRHEKLLKVQVPVRVVDSLLVPVPVPEVVVKAVPQKVDTAAILAAHFEEKTYRDTLINLPELKVEVKDKVTQNSLTERKLFVDYRPALPEKKNALVVSAYASKDFLPVLVGFRHKRLTCSVGYDFINRAAVGGISYEILRR